MHPAIQERFVHASRQLIKVAPYDAAVFYLRYPELNKLVAEFVWGPLATPLEGHSMGLERKLSGWVAAMNSCLFNLNPFPDFLSSPEPRPTFQF